MMLTVFTEVGASTSGEAPPDDRPGARSPGRATQHTHRPPCSKRKHFPVPKELYQTFLGLLFPTYWDLCWAIHIQSWEILLYLHLYRT